MSPIDRGRWPDFLVIGAGRTGTTSLHGLLLQHPEIMVPDIKEPNYFALRAMKIDLDRMPEESRAKWEPSISNPDAYQALFVPRPQTHPMRFGEISPVYLSVPGTAEEIAGAIPDARLVAILRDPVERAVSHHAHNVKLQADPEPDFAAALKIDRAKAIHSEYFRQGLFAELLEPYFAAFRRDQILLLDHSELARDINGTAARVFAHIGVDPSVRLRELDRMLRTDPAELAPSVRDELIRDFREDTARLIEEFGFEPARGWCTAQ